MRPKNLKFPFQWEERKPTYHEGVLFVPRHYEHHDQWKDDGKFFFKKNSVFIEFCSGNGDWVIERARNHPLDYWIAVEMQFERVRKIWSKMNNHGISNLLIVCGKAQEFVSYYLPKNYVDEIFVNFPDPWPKPRHAKHRLIQKPFINQLADKLKPGGKATFVTDDPFYRLQMIEEMCSHHNWKSCFPHPCYLTNLNNYGSSWFETLWKEKGKDLFYLQFERQSR